MNADPLGASGVAEDETPGPDPGSRRSSRTGEASKGKKKVGKEPGNPIRPPTSLTRRFIRYLIGFGVGVVLGSLPFLGYVAVPGFKALIDVLPHQLKEDLLAFTAPVMGIIAASVQYYAGERIAHTVLRRRYSSTLVTLGAGLLLLLALYSEFVEPVPVGRKKEKLVSVVIGPSRIAGCECPPQDDDVLCIRKVGLSREAIGSCWGSRTVRRIEFGLRVAYLLVVGSFASAIGLVVLRDELQRQQRGGRRRRPVQTADEISQVRELARAQPEAPAAEAPPGGPERHLGGTRGSLQEEPARDSPPPGVPEFAYDLFLSYTSEDREFVERLVADLNSRGLAIWWDRSQIGAGHSISGGISRGLSKSRQFAVVLSPAAVRSRWVNKEIGAALSIESERSEPDAEAQAPFLIPVLFQKCDVPALLKDKRRADFTNSYEQGFEELLLQLLPRSSRPQSQPH